MSPEFILRMSLCRPASCGAYTKPSDLVRRASIPPHLHAFWKVMFAESQTYERDYDRRVAEMEIENMLHASEYAEPGYPNPKKGILFANWNYFPAKASRLLEQYGYEIEWSDEWYICECGKAFRTTSDSYSWQPSYALVNECEMLCIDCLKDDPTDALREKENNPRTAFNLDGIDPADHGYVLANEEDYENGWYGRNGEPEAIYKALREQGVTEPILFQIDGVGQFSVSFKVWKRMESED